MAGRPRKPVSVKVAEGKTHMTKEEIKKQSDAEIKAPTNNVKPPSYLSKAMKDRFEELAKDLVELNLLSNLDTDTLARYIFAEFKHREVSQKMKSKLIDSDIDRYDKLSKVQDRYAKQARTAANDLGLTVSSRLKLIVPEPPEKPPTTPGEKRFGNRI